MSFSGCGDEETTKDDDDASKIGETVNHNGFTYVSVTSPKTGKIWLDRNLGATQACTSITDSKCYGEYYQWGRETDGHEKITSSAANSQVAVIINAGDAFYNGYSDWTTADTDGSLRQANWNKTDGTSVCPAKYRVPTQSELSDDVDSDISSFESFLKLPLSGSVNYVDANWTRNTIGNYWTQDTSIIKGKSDTLTFTRNNFNEMDVKKRAFALSIRCIKD